ncbi:MAG TPA: hypothetical protein QF644_02315 [Candidatus Poseidoniaceae archaeon]|nr:hypothetical protein [Candidatus Poseidoniaceae archaeon]
MDLRSAMAAARAEAESKQRKKHRDKQEKSEKKRSRSGEDMGLESFDPVNYVAKEKAETASMWLVLGFAISVALLMRFGIMPSLNHGDTILWLLPVLSVFMLPSIHRVVMPESFVEHYTKGTWFKASFLHIFTWLAVTLLLVNPPLGDIGSPEVANQWTVILIDEFGNHTYPEDGPTMLMEDGNIRRLEINLNTSNSEKVWLIFAVRDNLDVNKIEMNITLNGNELVPTREAFNEINEIGINSTWEEKIIDLNRIKDVGYAVELENLSEGFWDVRLTLSEQGEPWVNISEEYVWTIRVLSS